tara:strand:+ start:318 stop:1316 length:999 start_codon:yes stop_codon:yes gene_type:complete
MILKNFEINKINYLINKFILFYGKNEGFKNSKIKEITSKKSQDKIFKYDEKEIIENTEEFYNDMLSRSLFENNKIIIINRSTDKILPVIDYLSSKNLDGIIFIIKSDILEKRSKLRSIFEKNKDYICIPFYPDTNETLVKLAQNFFNSIKTPISSQNINLIVNKCNGDREYLNNELEKISLFTNNKEKINSSDLIKLVNLNEDFSINELVDTCLSKNIKRTLYILNENNFSTEDCIIIIKTFLNKCKRILKLIDDYETNKDLSKTISNAKPPVFWKDKDIVRQQITNWTSNKMKKMIYNLNDLELEVKKINFNQVNMVTNFILENSSVNINN